MGHKHFSRAIRILVVLPFLAASIALAGFAFASSASAAGGASPIGVAPAAQQCDEDAVGCDYLGDYGIGCINGDIVGDVDGTAINCDVDGDVNGTGINSDATGNMQNCINGDPASVSGSSINCGDFAPGAGPGPGPGPGPNPNPSPNDPDDPGKSGDPPAVIALPSTGSGSDSSGTQLALVLTGLAAVAVVGFAASMRLGRAED